MGCWNGERIQILSLTPGRLRIHRPPEAENSGGRQTIEAALRGLPGVREVQVNPLTGNVLIRFDPQETTGPALLEAVRSLSPDPRNPHPSPHRGGEADGAAKPVAAAAGSPLVRAGLRGILGHALVDTVFYTLAFAEPFGLPLAGLGALHLGFDVLAWTAAFAPLLGQAARAREGNGQARGGAGRLLACSVAG